jgi:hypothetical protein
MCGRGTAGGGTLIVLAHCSDCLAMHQLPAILNCDQIIGVQLEARVRPKM